MAQRDKRVQRAYREDGSGYWIELAPGWQNGNDPGTHAIVEDTKRRAYEVLRMARPCRCIECVELKQFAVRAN